MPTARATTRRWMMTLVMGSWLYVSTTAEAQNAEGGPQQDPADGPRRVLDPAVEDLGPLSESLRLLDTGLGLPGSFENVQAVPGYDDMYMRVAGGLYAVFPRSLYVSTRFGDAPIIPNDTVFYIGPPPSLSDAVPPRPLPEELMKPRAIGAGSRMISENGEPSGPAPGDADFVPSIAETTGYRSARLLELMRRAGAASDATRSSTVNH